MPVSALFTTPLIAGFMPAGASARKCFGKSSRAATFAPGDSTRWFRGLEPVFARHPSTGEAEGVGISFFPDSERPKRSRLFEPDGGF